MQETIRLDDVDGIAQHSGVDENGNTWCTFEVDSFAEQEPGECVVCGQELWSGWLCLDGGDEVCHEHIVIASVHTS